jgi:hypothetical protein
LPVAVLAFAALLVFVAHLVVRNAEQLTGLELCGCRGFWD